MAERLRSHGGGIRGLRRLLTEHGEAVEYELLTLGLRIDDLGTRRLSWRDLKVVVSCSPPGGALHRAVAPDAAAWTPDTYLLAAAVDALAAGNWQRSGGKKTPRPNPVWRPGQVAKKRRSLTAEALKQVNRDVVD